MNKIFFRIVFFFLFFSVKANAQVVIPEKRPFRLMCFGYAISEAQFEASKIKYSTFVVDVDIEVIEKELKKEKNLKPTLIFWKYGKGRPKIVPLMKETASFELNPITDELFNFRFRKSFELTISRKDLEKFGINAVSFEMRSIKDIKFPDWSKIL
jgi:hypothetical protein